MVDVFVLKVHSETRGFVLFQFKHKEEPKRLLMAQLEILIVGCSMLLERASKLGKRLARSSSWSNGT